MKIFIYILFKFLLYLFDTIKIQTDFIKNIIYNFISFYFFLHFLTLNKLLRVIYFSVCTMYIVHSILLTYILFNIFSYFVSYFVYF